LVDAWEIQKERIHLELYWVDDSVLYLVDAWETRKGLNYSVLY
jgi:hypothetical protein